ncbi:MAG: monovalent cation:proton antiporter-2 (CPA2) family protein [Pseudomonadota bacterium]
MAASGGGEFLVQAATYLGAAAVAVPVFQRLKLGSILGYVTAGVIVGPSGLNLLYQEEGVFHIAELGVVLFLFVIGLELSLSRLWALRKDIFAVGAAQMGLTGLVIAAILVGFEALPNPAAIIAGLAFAFSSTAFALQYMKDRGELTTPYGRRAFPILLFQDLAVIPLLAAMPFVAGMAASAATGSGPANETDGTIAAGWLNAAKGAGVIAALIVIGRYALNPVFRFVASSGSREAFAAMALFIVAAVSLAVSWAGLSMALGAFLAGVLLAESSYRHQIETDIEPFRGLLLGLFFISIGMDLNVALIIEKWQLVIGAALVLVMLKMLLLTALVRAFGFGISDSAKTGAVLSQSGEFAFVVFSLGVTYALFTSEQATIMSAIVTLTMIMTPFTMMAASRIPNEEQINTIGLEAPPMERGHVIIAGFGRMGQIVSQVLLSAGCTVTAIDRDPKHIQNAERFGFKVYYGDAARLDVLLTAGAGEACAVILTMDNAEAVNYAVGALRQRFPNLPIMAVAHDRMHEIDLRPLTPNFIVRETLESSLTLARETLRTMKVSDEQIEDYVQEFRVRDRERLLAQMDYGPEAGLEIMHKRFKGADKAAE